MLSGDEYGPKSVTAECADYDFRRHGCASGAWVRISSLKDARSFLEILCDLGTPLIEIELTASVTVCPVAAAEPVGGAAADFKERRAVVHPTSMLYPDLGSIQIDVCESSSKSVLCQAGHSRPR